MGNKLNNNSFSKVIEKCLKEIRNIKSDSECRKIIFNELNIFFRSKTNISFSLEDNIKKYVLDILNSENQDILKFLNYNSDDEKNKYSVTNVEDYLNSLKEIISTIDYNIGYDEELLTRYLKAYMECSQEIIVNNDKAYNEIFRNSKLVKNLHNLGTIPSKKLEEKDLMYVSLYSPYTVHAIIEIVNDIIKYRKEINDSSLSDIRCNLFIKEELKKFKRLSSKTSSLWDSRRVFYDDKSGEIISFPTNYLSSVEALDSINLVDKIKNYIKNEINDNYTNSNKKSIDVNVLVIGSINRNNELNILLDIIIHWFNRNYNKIKLNLNITSIISDKDIFENKVDITKKLNGNKVSAITKVADYLEILFDIDVLKNYIINNDISFILNCPFISFESFSVNKSQSLNYYAKKLKATTNMKKLNTFYKIIIDSSENYYSDKIGRLIYESSLEYMIDLIKASNGEKLKELYVSVDDSYAGYSDCFDSVLAKEEMDNTNKMTFSKYSNKPESQLDYNIINPINFKISIWTLFKHISRDYLLNNLGNILSNSLGKDLEYEKRFALFDNICLDFIVNDYNVDISIKYLELFDQILLKEIGVQKEMLDSIKNEINNSLSKVFKPLFEDILFNDSNNREDLVMKEAFYYAVYESSKRVNDMHFIHNYLFTIYNGNRYSAKFNDNFNKDNIPNNSVCNECFNDKKLYNIAMDQCEYNYKLTTGQLALMNKANYIFEQGALAYYTLKNIENLCERYGDHTGKLKENVESAKQLLK